MHQATQEKEVTIMPRRAYAYNRCSDKKQLKGRSLDRQEDDASWLEFDWLRN